MAVRSIATDLTLSGEKEFNDAMRAVNSNLKNLRSDMSAVSSEFRKNENSTAALRAKQKILQEQYAQQQEVVRALTERLAKVRDAYGEDSAMADKVRQQLNAATVAMNRSKDALDDNSKQLRQHLLLLDKAPGAYGKLGKAVSTFASGAKTALTSTATAAAAMAGAGVAAVGMLGTMGVATLETLKSYAADAAQRSKDAYDQANDLAEQAREAALAGNEEAAMKYLRQADELIAGIDTDYLRFGNTLENLDTSTTAAKDALGKILLPALNELGEEGADLLTRFSEELNASAGDTEKMGEIIAKYVGEAISLLRKKVPEFAKIAVDLLSGLGEGLTDEENLNSILDDVEGILNYILDVLEKNASKLGDAAATIISSLASFLIENGPDLLTAGVSLITNIIQGLADNADKLGTEAVNLVFALLDALLKAAPALLQAGGNLIGNLISGILRSVGSLLGIPDEVMDRLAQRFQDAVGVFRTIGSNIVAGISEGIAERWAAFTSWVGSLFDNLIGGVMAQEGIHSPSTRWRDQVGKQEAAGVGVGFEEEMRNVSRQMQQSMDNALPDTNTAQFNASVSGDSGISSGNVNYMGGVSIVVNGYNAQNDDELAETIGYKLQEILERRGA